MTVAGDMSSNPMPEARGWVREFGLICAGQLVSLFGSSLTAAAFSFWVFETTHSTTRYALLGFSATVPALLVGPLAGVILDRTSRRRVLVVADVGAGIATAALALLLFRGDLRLSHVYGYVFVSSVCAAFRWPALAASASLLAPKEMLGRASAMLQGIQALAYLASPVLGAVMLTHLGLTKIVLLDLATFLVALGTLASVRIPRPAPSSVGQEMRGTLLREMNGGWRFIASHRGLLGLLGVMTVFNFGVGCVQAVLSPFLLIFTAVDTVGVVLSIGLSGMIVGTVIGGALRPRRRVPATLRLIAIGGALLACIPLHASAAWVGFVTFAMMVAVAAASTVEQAVWMAKVPADIQGRVFTIRQMISSAALPIAFAIAGPVVQRVLDPLFARDSAGAVAIARVIGAVPSYGIAALIVFVGIVSVAVAGAASLVKRIRDLELELPDGHGER